MMPCMFRRVVLTLSPMEFSSSGDPLPVWHVPGDVPRELVFPSGSGTPIDAKNLRKDFAKLVKAAKVPRVRWHDLRQTYASILLSDEIPVLYVAGQLGHSSATVTLEDYAHWIPNSDGSVVDRLDDPGLQIARIA